MNIDVQFIPHAQHRFITIGHWFFEGEILVIQISQEVCWENRVAVLFHELIEAAWCVARGITTEECDAFDELFEKEYAEGKWPKSIEAGFDKRCPYRWGHIWGTIMERIVLFAIGANRKECDAECDKLMGVEP